MRPFTDAHQAPADVTNPYGKGIHHLEMMRRLKKLNPNIHAPLPEHYPGWFPGKESGVTCLWLGTPSEPGSKKLCAFTLGTIPEWTIKGKRGELRRKGWRLIFAKLIKARACTKRDLELAFLVNLDRDDKKGDGLCIHCARANKKVKAVGANRLCVLHDRIQKVCARAIEAKKEARWLQSLSPEKRILHTPGRVSSRLVLDLRSGASQANTRSTPARPTVRRSLSI